MTGLLISAYFKNNAERGFSDLLGAYSFNVMGAVELDGDGQPQGLPGLGDPRFLEPGSGWYWAVSSAADPLRPLLHSRSLSGDALDAPPMDAPSFGDEFRRTYAMPQSDGFIVQRLEAQLYFGEQDRLYQVTIGGNRSGVEASMAQFNRQLFVFFVLFGVLTLIALFIAVRLGLRPLQRAQNELEKVRQGKSARVEGSFPSEVAPLVKEVNTLIQANQSVIERARTQVGNLAHALKTPLAVILNDTNKKGALDADLVRAQARIMQDQIRHYLDRARVSAQRGTLTGNTQVKPLVDRLLRVMRKLNPEKMFSLEMEYQDTRFAGEAQDLEELLGNLLENASRHAKQHVMVSVSAEDQRLVLSIDDDGPGLTHAQRQRALQRGVRLDETEPGSGLGLSIVRDIATEYGGKFVLESSALGGLRAVVFLPRMEGNPPEK
ncbi:MAG: HAMP domain-containing sensor histidine kinase [Pseudomonadota bacterium]